MKNVIHKHKLESRSGIQELHFMGHWKILKATFQGTQLVIWETHPAKYTEPVCPVNFCAVQDHEEFELDSEWSYFDTCNIDGFSTHLFYKSVPREL